MRASTRQMNDRDHVRIRFGISFIDDVRMSDVRQVGMRLLIVLAAAFVLLAGCDYNDDHDHDDFIVFFPSGGGIEIDRASGRPFDVLEIGVTPFFDPIFGDKPYIFFLSGILWLDDDVVTFELPDDVRQAFIDPLGEHRVVEVFMSCDCVIDYVILRAEFGRTTLFFD